MKPEAAKIIADFLLDSIEHEFATTKKVLAALPEAKQSWRPHEKGMTAGELAWHIVTGDLFFLEAITKQEFVLAPPPPAPKTVSEMLAIYDQKFAELLARVRALPAEKLAKNTKFAIFDFPLVVYVQFVQSHRTHHRGQLSTYLRAMGEKVPAIYGGSADEPFQETAGV